MKLFSEAERLKRKARGAYKTFLRATEHLDCGNAVAKTISPSAAKAAQTFNDAMDELAKIDPACPAARL